MGDIAFLIVVVAVGVIWWVHEDLEGFMNLWLLRNGYA